MPNRSLHVWSKVQTDNSISDAIAFLALADLLISNEKLFFKKALCRNFCPELLNGVGPGTSVIESWHNRQEEEEEEEERTNERYNGNIAWNIMWLQLCWLSFIINKPNRSRVRNSSIRRLIRRVEEVESNSRKHAVTQPTECRRKSNLNRYQVGDEELFVWHLNQ